MSWKSVSKISRNQQPAQEPEKVVQEERKPSVPPTTPKVEADFLMQSLGIKEPSKGPVILTEDNRTQDEIKEDISRDEQKETLKQEYVAGKSFDTILVESGVPRSTLHRWRKEGKWDEEKQRKQILLAQLQETLAFYENPTNTETAIAEKNVQLLLKIQGINLSKLMHKALAGEAPDIIALSMSDALNKYSGMLEKLIKSDQSLKTGGVEKKEVVHIHQLDMDDALNLALEMKKQGKAITVQDAMAILQAQQSSKKVQQ